ncbi:MAG: cytochrome c5 family protein [Rubrivivax sp.]|nr:cytochrome c5 family protein [Rubrivivax sp.]
MQTAPLAVPAPPAPPRARRCVSLDVIAGLALPVRSCGGRSATSLPPRRAAAWHGACSRARQSSVPTNPHPGASPVHFSKLRLPAVAVLTFGIAASVAPAQANDGKAVYDKTCAMCHAQGVANAPKLGDKAAWAPRVAQGVPAMVATVVKGKGAMPPKAGNATLTDAQIKAGVEYMLASVK